MSSSPVKAGGARTCCSTSTTAALSWYSIALGGMDPARSLSLQRGMDGASLQLSLFIVLRRRAPCDTPHRQVINCRDIYKQLNKLALGGGWAREGVFWLLHSHRLGLSWDLSEIHSLFPECRSPWHMAELSLSLSLPMGWRWWEHQ